MRKFEPESHISRAFQCRLPRNTHAVKTAITTNQTPSHPRPRLRPEVIHAITSDRTRAHFLGHRFDQVRSFHPSANMDLGAIQTKKSLRCRKSGTKKKPDGRRGRGERGRSGEQIL